MPSESEGELITLTQLYAFRDHIERLIARRGVRNPRSEMERHLVEHGHRLAYGCCRASATSDAPTVGLTPAAAEELAHGPGDRS